MARVPIAPMLMMVGSLLALPASASAQRGVGTVGVHVTISAAVSTQPEESAVASEVPSALRSASTAPVASAWITADGAAAVGPAASSSGPAYATVTCPAQLCRVASSAALTETARGPVRVILPDVRVPATATAGTRPR